MPANSADCQQNSQTYFEALGGSNQPRSDTLTLYLCGWERCSPSHAFGPAVRPHYLFHYIRSGRGQFFSRGHCYYLHAGQGFLICPGDSTYYAADREDPWSYCWFGFDGQDAGRILHQCGLSADTPIFTDHSGGQLEERLQELLRLFADGAPNEYEVLGRLYLVFAQMMQPVQQTLSEHSYARQAAELIRCNYGYAIQISEIARHIGIDRSHLYRVFYRVYQCSPQQYLMETRMQAACKLLQNPDISIPEAALSCGFRELPAFYRQFGKHFSQTPAQYRAALQANQNK